MKKYQIITLGCRVNQYESQLFSDQLRQIGYVPALNEPADLCIINTCSVTDQADATSRAQIRKVARKHPHARIIVTGCMAENASETLRSIDERIEWISNKDKRELISLIGSDLPELRDGIERFDGHTRAFVKVQDGCNAFCSYCIIPYVRGRSRSRSVPTVVNEVRGLIANGYREIVLTGVNVGDYEADGNQLADLVRAIDALDGLDRLRISSIDPNHLDEKLMDAILKGRHTCSHLHMVLQSGSDAILKRMNRKYTRGQFLNIVERFVQTKSDFTFTTDIIVGFPGESESDFEQTLDVVRQVKFAKVHLFPYSVRSQTKAASFPDQIPAPIIQQRKERLQQVADQMAFEWRQRFLNRTEEVLLEEGDDVFLFGHTNHFISVQVLRGQNRPNELVFVELLKNGPTHIEGRVV